MQLDDNDEERVTVEMVDGWNGTEVAPVLVVEVEEQKSKEEPVTLTLVGLSPWPQSPPPSPPSQSPLLRTSPIVETEKKRKKLGGVDLK